MLTNAVKKIKEINNALPPADASIVKDLTKLEAAAEKFANLNPDWKAEFEQHKQCKKSEVAENIIITTGTIAAGKASVVLATEAEGLIAMVPVIGPEIAGSTTPAVLSGSAVAGGVTGAYLALDRIDEHHALCKKKAEEPKINHVLAELEKNLSNEINLSKQALEISHKDKESVHLEQHIQALSLVRDTCQKQLEDLKNSPEQQVKKAQEMEKEWNKTIESSKRLMELTQTYAKQNAIKPEPPAQPQTSPAPISAPEPGPIQLQPNFHKKAQADFMQKIFSQNQTPMAPVFNPTPPPAYSGTNLPGFNAYRNNVSYVLRPTQDPIMKKAQRYSSFSFNF